MSDNGGLSPRFRTWARPGPVSHLVYAIGDAGSGATAWRAVDAALRPDVQIRAVRLPGRENRTIEPSLDTVEAQVADVMAGLAPLLAADKRPYALAGACSGAVTAYELARHLYTVDVPAPTALVVIGQPSPALLPPAEPTPPSREELRSWLADQGVAIRPDLFDLVEPMLRADIRAARGYRHRPGPMLRCRLAAIRGEQDPGITRDAVMAWSAVTTGAFTFAELPGAHDLLRAEPTRIAELLAHYVKDEPPADVSVSLN